MSKSIVLHSDGTWEELEEVQPGTPPTGELPAGYISPHFREAEFDCNHCGKHGDLISKELLDVLEDVRARFKASVTINSGVRCDQHNKAVGGASNSRHKVEHADAADIVVQDVAPSKVHSYLTSTYPGKYGIGKYNSFTHIDVRPGGPARW